MPIIIIGATSDYWPLPFQFSQLLNRIVQRIDDRDFLSVVSIAIRIIYIFYTYIIQQIGVFETMQVEFTRPIQINIVTLNNHIFTSTSHIV